MFSIVGCLDTDTFAPPSPPLGYDDSYKKKRSPTWAEEKQLPGPDVMLPSGPPMSSSALDPSKSIAELNASFIASGPFKLKTTPRLDCHLYLNLNNELLLYEYWKPAVNYQKELWSAFNCHPSTLEIYTGHAFERCYTHITKGLINSLFDVDSVRAELRLSSSLLFARDEKSMKLAKKLFTKKQSSNWRWAKRSTNDDSVAIPFEVLNVLAGAEHLREYRCFRPHLAFLQESMRTWKPRRFSELFVPGYYDRLAWFTAIFGVVFGIIGTLSLVTSVIQTAVDIAEWRKP